MTQDNAEAEEITNAWTIPSKPILEGLKIPPKIIIKRKTPRK
jgi:hypothetical protein